MQAALLKKMALTLKEDNSDTCRKGWGQFIIEKDIALMSLMPLMNQEKPVPMRFLWVMGGICETDPQRVFPVIAHLYSIRNEVGIKNFDRSLAKFFCFSGIPEDLEGEVTDLLFQWLQDPGISVSTKNFSLSALHHQAAKFPELRNELKLVILDQLDKNTSSFESRARKVLKQLDGE